MRPEDRFVERLREAISHRDEVVVGLGDDAAVVLSPAGPIVITTDTLVESVDFLPGEDPKRLGRRAVSVGLSDLAAMGAWPDFFLLTVGFPETARPDLAFVLTHSAARRGEAEHDAKRAPMQEPVLLSQTWQRLAPTRAQSR